MDSEYLQHIESSPYISEALPARMRAGASALGQRLRGMMGHEDPYQSLDYTRLITRYNSFVSDVRAILKEFAFGPTSPAQRLQKMQNPPLTPQQKEIINELLDLYNQLSRGVFPPGTSPEMRRQISLKETLRENYATRKWAQGTNDANKILSAYVNDLHEIYQNFSNDIKKMFPQLPNQSLSKIFTTKVNDPSAARVVSDVESFIKKTEPEVPPVQTPPPTQPTQPQPPAQGGGKKQSADDFVALIAECVDVLNERIQRDTAHSAGYFSKPYGKGDYYLPKTFDEPSPTDIEWGHVPADINPDAEEDDAKKAALLQKKANMEKGGHYVKDPTSGEWKFVLPKPLDEEDEGDEESDDGETGGIRKLDIGDQEVEMTGKFVYDFASLYKKYPGGFNIEATEGGGKKIQLPSGKVKVLRVFWNWKKRQNSIMAKVRDEDGNNWTEGEVLSFYDDQVNPRSPSYQFDLELFAEQVDKQTAKLFQEASPAQLSRLDEEEKIAKPAFYAIIRRKGVMEFKRKDKDALGLFLPKGSTDPNNPLYGQVEIGRGKEKGKILTQPELMVRYHSGESDDQQMWKKALENLGYFEQIQGAKDKFDDLTMKISAAKHELIKKHPAANPQNVDELIGMATKKLGTKILTMTPEEIAASSVENVSPGVLNSPPTAYIQSTSTITHEPEENEVNIDDVPEAVDAVAALIKLGTKKSEAYNLVHKVIDAKGTDLKADEYTKLALAMPKDQIKTSPVSKPEGEAPKPSVPTPDEPTINQEHGNVKFDENGNVLWTKPDGKVRKFSPKQINNMASPKLMAALKKKGYPFEKFGVKSDIKEWMVNPFQLSNFL